jgi:hypothetical protein
MKSGIEGHNWRETKIENQIEKKKKTLSIATLKNIQPMHFRVFL